ncbi:MAG: hypothetical protein LUI39_08375 [Lachnospiraceae bacterium]|nr:hypothetical protein [Lachnospiraceae bacterium]
MSDNNWMNNPALGSIDPAKLQMLSSLAGQAQKKDKSEVLPFLMALSGGDAGANPGDTAGCRAADEDVPNSAAANGASSGSLSFSSDETEAIIDALKAGKSPQEIKKMDKILSVMKKIKKENP